MAKSTATKTAPFRGYELAETYREGKLVHCDVWLEDKHLRSFHGESARDEAKRFINRRIASEKYPRINMRPLSNGR